MGGDGGSIPRRVELVRNKQKREDVGRDAENAAKWRHCALSQAPLRQPIVSCQLGRLYNKEAVIEKLLKKSHYPGCNSDHIRTLKSVRELRLTLNPTLNSTSSNQNEASNNQPVAGGSGVYIDVNQAPYICPVVGLEMNGLHKFVYLWSCGCVMSKKAVDTVGGTVCLKCGAPYTASDVILINPMEEAELAAANQRLAGRSAGAAKKRKHHPEEPATTAPVAASSQTPTTSSSQAPTTSSSQAPTTSSSQTTTTSSQAPTTSSNQTTTTSSRHNDLKKKSGSQEAVKRRKEGAVDERSALQNDPKSSAVYKSLFNTSAQAKQQVKAHWVTYNPLYYG